MFSGFDEDGHINEGLRGFAHACPPNSPLRLNPYPALNRSEIGAQTPKSFIASQAASMDLCTNPQHLPLHGLLADQNPALDILLPIFSLSKTSLHADILGVPTEQWIDDSPSIPFARRKGRLLWRGSSTGGIYQSNPFPGGHEFDWRITHRVRLVELGNKMDGEIQVLPAPKGMSDRSLAAAQQDVNPDGSGQLPRSIVNQQYMDVAFTDGPIRKSWMLYIHSPCNIL
jgi:hypothetical protein